MSSEPLNVVLVSSIYYPNMANLPNLTHLETTKERRSGIQTTFSSNSAPGLSLSNLPRPTGRIANYSLQNKVLKNADLFILHATTADFTTGFHAKCPRDVPSICWIDNSNEEETVEKWKKQSRQRFLNLQRTTNDIATQKYVKSDPKKIETYRLGWYSTPEDYPITSAEKVKKIIRQMRSTETFEIEFFECNSTSMSNLLRSKEKPEVSDDFSQKWELMMQRVAQIGEKTRAQTAVARKEREVKAESKRRMHQKSIFVEEEDDDETIELLPELSL